MVSVNRGSRAGLLLGAWGAVVCTVAAAADAGTGQPAPEPPAGGDKAFAVLKALDEASRAREAITTKVVVAETMGSEKVVRSVDVYTAENDTALVLLVTAPKVVAGSGYLRIENNLFFYDPNQGRWERRTNRERLSGTNMRTSDLSFQPLADVYVPELGPEESSGGARLRKLVLIAKPNAQVLYPKLVIWVSDENLERKREEYSESGKLLRTSYITKTMKVHSTLLNKDIVVPAEVKLVDEVEKDRQSVLQFKSTVLAPIPASTFTKGWLETKQR